MSHPELRVSRLDLGAPAADAELDAFFAACPTSVAQQTPAWRRVIEALGSDEPCVLARRRGDALVGVLPGYRFEGPRGAVSVEVHSRFHANDGRVLVEAARRGLGVAVVPRYLAEEDLRTGRLIQVLEGFPLASFWLKALVPSMKMNKPAVRELVNARKAEIKDGKFNIFAGPIKDQDGNVRIPEGQVMSDKDQLAFDWYVEGVQS